MGLMWHGDAKDSQGFLDMQPGTVTSAKGWAASYCVFCFTVSYTHQKSFEVYLNHNGCFVFVHDKTGPVGVIEDQ